ncbi:MAG TPA: ABC transporter permease [Opitutus sp.]|nr:ABC transporter permease [Opitutus sp.]
MLPDFRFAVRQLRQTPGFTFIAVLTLALGIGANTAIFSVVRAVLLAPMHYHAPGELVQLQSRNNEQGISDFAPATFGDLAATSESFASLAAQYYYYVNLTGAGTPARLNSADTTSDYFKLFGVAPLLGRTWTAADLAPGRSPVVVLSYDLWKNQFDSRASIVGQTIMLDDNAYAVIGVMPAFFKDPAEIAQLWRPMRPGADNLLERASRYWTVFGRLKPGMALARANEELALIGRRLATAHPASDRGWTLRAVDLRRLVVGDYRAGLLNLLGAAGCVLLVTCANIAGLSIGRASARRKELAIRAAVGSSRLQLVRLLLAENLILAFLGSVAGVVLARWGLDALIGSLPAGWLPRADEIALNLPVLAITLALTVVTGVATGLAPALSASRITPGDALNDGARGSAAPSARRLRSVLVVAEIALALVLLAATGVLGRSFAGLIRKQSALDAGRVLSLTVSLPEKRYQNPRQCWDFFSRADAAIAALPGVAAVGFTHTSPFRWGIPADFAPQRSSTSGARDAWPAAFVDSVSVDYFKSMGIPLRAGRTFTAGDDYRASPMVILSETAARRYFGAQNPVGRFIVSAPDGRSRFEVVGIVGDVPRSGLTAAVPLQVYRPFAQRTPPFATIMVRTSQAPAALAKSVQAALWRIDPDLPISEVAPLETYVSRSIAQPRLHVALFGLFAALALGLAAIGLYGLVAYNVSRRTREFGIRSSLGAAPREVLVLVLREGAALLALGLAVGLSAAWLTLRLLQSLVFETSLHDPIVFLVAPLLLSAVAAFACWLPARRAARIDPAIALRAD